MNKSKTMKYLNGKNVENYNCLDGLLDKYCSGELLIFLSKYQFTSIDIFPTVSKNGNSIEICITLQNIVANIFLMEKELEYSIYPLYANINEVDKNTFDVKYDLNFSFEQVIDSIFEKMINHHELKDISGKKRQKKMYETIANIFLIIPVIFFGVMVVLTLGCEASIKLNFWWVFFFVIIPLVIYTFFNGKSKNIISFVE